ncbi:hypothetical protein [Hyphococcus luteus]|uniref:EF-hand domain-containing protein n=1 Tax=Hyphococcus luteus TaxID=2058213 RepID=A0A2S7K2N0_9PROT|nr:hypothetical protein [Marinicaulis flavus]PQA86759.1 hypothetical protein CW354_14815 [Marinicaulis flavus]
MLRSTLICASLAALASGAYARESTDAASKADAKTITDAKQVGTRDEAKLYAKAEFDQADLDKDGKVSETEFIAYATIRAPMNNKADGAAGKKAANEKTDAAAVSETASAEEEFAEISNGDEAISEDELVEKRMAQFEEADADNDEALDAKERVQFAQMTTPKAPKNTL